MDSVRSLLAEAAHRKLVYCCNPYARRSRLYWLTAPGLRCIREIRSKHHLPQLLLDFPRVDWALYGWLCFTQRSAVVKILKQPLQPSVMKSRLRYDYPEVRVSANNIRDILRLLVGRGIAHKLWLRKQHHPSYELTRLGSRMQVLLLRAELPIEARNLEHARRTIELEEDTNNTSQSDDASHFYADGSSLDDVESESYVDPLAVGQIS
jgi:hypothetical protein